MLKKLRKTYPEAKVEVVEMHNVTGITVGYRFTFENQEGFEIPCTTAFSEKEFLSMIKGAIKKRKGVIAKMERLLDWNYTKKKVYPKLVLKEVGEHYQVKRENPNQKDYMYLYYIQEDGNEISIESDYLKHKGITIEELHAVAMKNLIEEIRIEGLNQRVPEGCEEDILGLAESDANELVYFITNNRYTYGAAAGFQPEAIKRMLEIYPDGYCMIANSIHEWVAFSPMVISERAAVDLVTVLLRPSHFTSELLLGDKVFKVDKTGMIS